MNRSQLEPEAIVDVSTNADTWPTEREIEQSMAISLKRIADALDKLSSPMVTVEQRPLSEEDVREIIGKHIS